MRITKVLAVAATGCVLAAAVAVPASAHAGSHPAKSKVFKTTISPKSGVKSGTTVTLKGTGALKSQTFTCVFIVSKGADYGVGHITGTTKSSKKGAVTCKGKFAPFKTSMHTSGKTASCPPTKAEAKAGYKCAYAVSNLAQTDSGIGYFTAK